MSFDSNINPDNDHQSFNGTHMQRRSRRGECSSIEQLAEALKEEIDAGAESAVPECTTFEASLDLSAWIPLHRPSMGPYAEGGDRDLPPHFQTSWTTTTPDTSSARASARLSHPQARVVDIIGIQDRDVQQIVQRAATRGIVTAIEAVDGYKYNFNNGWSAKDEGGQRFAYICQDGMQNKDRHANGFVRNREPLRREQERGVRKPTYDCRGNVSVKYSAVRGCVDVYYRHYAIHPRLSEQKTMSRTGQSLRVSPHAHRGASSASSIAKLENNSLSAKLSTEKSAYAPAPSLQEARVHEESNIGRPLKRKRDYEMPVYNEIGDRSLSLVELLKKAQSLDPPKQSLPTAPKANATQRHGAVNYDLPSWQEPAFVQPSRAAPAPSAPRQNQQRPSSQQSGAPYPPPYPANPPQPAQPPRSIPSANYGQTHRLDLNGPQWTVYVPPRQPASHRQTSSYTHKAPPSNPSAQHNASSYAAQSYTLQAPTWPNIAPPANMMSMASAHQTARAASPDPWFPRR